jgi:glycine/D-amino acid oxidase-like deaminating enzyme
MTLTYDAVVIGAGIVGAACACELARAGMRTAIVEAEIIGGGATAAGMGHIVVMDDSPAQLALTRYSQALWNELAPQLPENVEFDRCGTLWIAADDEEMREVRRKQTVYASVDVQAEVLDSQHLAEAEPNLRRPLAGALLVPSDAVLYPPCAALYLVDCAKQAGAALYIGKAVAKAERGRVVLGDGTELSAEHIIHATGAGATRLMPHLPVRKRKGHLVITDRYPDFVRHQLVELGYLKSAHSITSDSVAFNVQPRRTGQLLIGSSRQYDNEGSGIEQKIVSAMLARAFDYIPSLINLSSIRIWTGFRAATPDKLPLIGPTDDPSVFLATGHEGLGITTSLATARLLTDHLMGRESAIPLEPYLPERFAREVAYA